MAVAHSAAIVLAGGRGRRLGGLDKPTLRLGGASLLDIVLTAVTGAPTVVVGPDRALPDGVLSAWEKPAGGGPAAAIAAGLARLPPLGDDALVAIAAADLPALDTRTVRQLCARVGGRDGAVLVDADGRCQWLAGAWRSGALLRAVRGRADWTGRSVRELLGPLDPVRLAGHEDAAVDVDTPDDWRRVRAGHDRGDGRPL